MYLLRHIILCESFTLLLFTDTMYKQFIGIYMHACMGLTTDNCKLRELTINYTLASHTLSAEGVASESTYIYRYLQYIFLCTTVSHYYREMCFELATCADLAVPILVTVYTKPISRLVIT